jgi:HSP20 family protein
MTVKNLLPVSNRRKAETARSDQSEGPWSSLQRDINRLFEGFFTRLPLAPFPDEEFGRISPRMDMRETEGEYIVELEMPGMSEKDVNISFSEGLLTLSGEKKQDSESRNGSYYCSERAFGRFERSIPIAAEIDPEKTEAKFRNGLLRIRLPKKSRRQSDAKAIPIKIE